MAAYFRLLARLRNRKSAVLAIWVLSLLVIGLHLLTVWLGAGLVEAIMRDGRLPRSAVASSDMIGALDALARRLLERSSPFASLVAAVAALAVTRLLVSLLRFAKLAIMAGVNQRVLFDVRRELFARLTRLDLGFSRRNRPGELASLVVHDVDQLNYAIIDAVDRCFMQPLQLLVVLGMLWMLSPALTTLALVFSIACAGAIHLAGRRAEDLAAFEARTVAGVQGQVVEYLSGVILARSFGRESEEEHGLLQGIEALRRNRVRLMLTEAFVPQVVSIVFIAAFAVGVVFGGYGVFVTHTLTSAEVVKIAFLLPLVAQPVEALGTLYANIRSSAASAKRVFAFLDEAPLEVDNAVGAVVPPFHHEIVLAGVGYEVDGKRVLERVDLTVKQGQTVVIYGPSGAGKTTLLNLLAGFIRPTQGSIMIDGCDLRQVRLHSWRAQLGLVAQSPIFINATVRENLRYAQPEADDAAMEQALREVSMWDEEGALSRGLDTRVGNHGELLSGGERQRLAIARVLLLRPAVVLMDEPTAMLDHANRTQVIEALRRVCAKHTVLIVTHDRELRGLTDRVIEISAGQARRVAVEETPF